MNNFSKTLFLLLPVICFCFSPLLFAHGENGMQVSGNPGKRIFFKSYYFPNTEPLAEDEMRVIALGTGNPDLRKSQVAPSWFVELGNGDKFFFDVGIGSQVNFPALQISFRDADKVFLTHLHVDHYHDLSYLLPFRAWSRCRRARDSSAPR